MLTSFLWSLAKTVWFLFVVDFEKNQMRNELFVFELLQKSGKKSGEHVPDRFYFCFFSVGHGNQPSQLASVLPLSF